MSERMFAILEMDSVTKYITESELRRRMETIIGNVTISKQPWHFSDLYWRDMVLPRLLHGEPKPVEPETYEQWVSCRPHSGSFNHWKDYDNALDNWFLTMPGRGK